MTNTSPCHSMVSTQQIAVCPYYAENCSCLRYASLTRCMFHLSSTAAWRTQSTISHGMRMRLQDCIAALSTRLASRTSSSSSRSPSSASDHLRRSINAATAMRISRRRHSSILSSATSTSPNLALGISSGRASATNVFARRSQLNWIFGLHHNWDVLSAIPFGRRRIFASYCRMSSVWSMQGN